MADLQFIVARLAEEPFNVPIRAVDFDTKTSDELLGLLVNVVLGSLNSELKADVRVAPREELVEQIVQFLLMHKCPCVPGSEEEHHAWADGIGRGLKAVIHPILHWALSEYEHLQERTYLSKFLMPVDVPSEHLLMQSGGNSNLEELLEAYKELQAEFVDVHKQYKATKANGVRPPSDVTHAINQLEEEEQQLLDRLQTERAQTSNDPHFQLLLAEATQMRQAQDSEIRLEDQKQEQLHQLAAAKRRLTQARHLVGVIVSCKDQPIEALEDQHRKLVDRLETEVMQRRHEAELRLLQAEKEADVDKTEDDVEYLVEMAAQLEERLIRKQDELGSFGGRDARQSLEILKQDVADATLELHSTQDDLDALEMEMELLKSTNEGLRKSIQASDSDRTQRPGGTAVSSQELAELQDRVMRQAEVYNDAKEEMRKIQEEILRLKHVEDELKREHRMSQEKLQREEERAGVAGFSDINDKLQRTSKGTASLNEQKLATLDDISAMVQQIAHTLEGKKEELQPKIDELKQKRKQFEALQERHSTEKTKYDEAAAKLNSDNHDLENDCSRLRDEWLEKERRLGGSPEHDAPQQDAAKQSALFANLKKLLELQARSIA